MIAPRLTASSSRRPAARPSAVLPLAAAGLAIAVSAAAQPAPFNVGPVTAAPGTIVSGTLAVAARAGDEGTTIPISVAHGAKAGPVLALVAGTHGFEYPPILALQRLRASLDPTALAGTVIMVHVANMPSFLGRTVYYSPVDGQNLNRVFPGKADGTLSERIADVITREVIAPATAVVDLHCGDGNEDLRPYSYWVTTGPPAVTDETRALALAFGLDHIVVDTARPTEPGASVYLSNTAITRGKPGLTIESGGMGLVDDVSIARIERGIAGLLRHLGMRPDGPPPVEHPIWIERSQVLVAGATGLFHAAVEKGHTVAEGTVVGHITDFHGRTLETIRAPFAGEILYVVGTPPVTKGEPVGFVGEVKRD